MKIPNDPFLGTHYIGKKELKAVSKVIRSKSLFRYHGPNLLYKTKELESMLKKYLGVKYILACSSGTSALKLSAIGCSIGPGDEVIMTPFTFIASAGSILSCGAVPKFVDIDETMNIDPLKIEQAVTTKTKAIMAIHIQGQPCDMKKIQKIAKKYSLKIIEDVAQAFGSSIKNKFSGTFGDCSAFSLQAGKTITCGEGGFIATNNENIYRVAKMYHDNGGYRVKDEYPSWENGKTIFGENFKLTETQSAIAIEQLKKIDKILSYQEKIYEFLIKNIDKKFYSIRPTLTDAKNVNVSLCLQFKNKKECDDFISYMNKNNILFDKYCSNLINEFDTFKYENSWNEKKYPYNVTKYVKTNCSKAKTMFETTAWLNLSASLKKKHLKYIIFKLKEYQNER